MEKTINTIIIQVTKMAGKKADNILLNEMKCVYNNKNNGLAINVISNRLNISNDWNKKIIINSSPQLEKQMSLTNNPDLWLRVVSSNPLASSSDPRLVVLFESSPRRVTLVESSSSSQGHSWSNSRQVIAPHRVILGESSCVIE